MSTVLVSGACGTIGDKTCSGLLKRGYRVIAVDAKESEYNKGKDDYVFFQAQPNERDKYNAAFNSEHIDAFVHLACSADNDFSNIIDDECIGMSRSCDRYIYKMALDAQVTHIFLLSTSQVYEPKKTREPIRESDDAKGSTNYAKLKLESEKALEFNVKKAKNLYTCVMRLAPIYTKDYIPNLMSRITDPKDGVAFLYRTGDYGFHFCNLYNFTEFIMSFMTAATHPSFSGIYNVSDNQPITAEDIVKFMKEFHRLGPVVQRNFGSDSIKNIFASKKPEKTDYRFLDASDMLNNNWIDNTKAKRIFSFRWNLANSK